MSTTTSATWPRWRSRLSAASRRPITALVLAAIALLAWVYASPIGSSPDDDYHLTSSWCAGPAAAELCVDAGDPDDAGARIVPEALPEIACFAFDSEASAACQGTEFSWDPSVTAETGRSNVGGGYPPVYYAVTGLFAGADVQLSALLMRLLSVGLFLGLAAVLWMLLPSHRRPALVWGWLLAAVPLGAFFLASNNPSGWAIAGVGLSWIALLAYVDEPDRRRATGLGTVFVLAALMAAGARGDAALYVGLGIVVVAILTYETRQGSWLPSVRWLRKAILPAAMSVVALVLFVTSRQVSSGLTGFGGASSGSGSGSTGDGADLEAVIQGPALLAYNILHLPSLWGGLLIEAGVGWLDTPMPSLVAFAVWGAVLAVAFTALALLERRTAIAVSLIGAVLVVLPLYVLQAGGDRVGQEVQPRYLLPLMVLFIGVLLLGRAGRTVRFTALQSWMLAAALAGAHFVALQVTMRRFITGIDGAAVSLGSGAEWWWQLPVGPDVVWLVGSAAFAGLVVWAVPLVRQSRDHETRTAALAAPPAG